MPNAVLVYSVTQNLRTYDIHSPLWGRLIEGRWGLAHVMVAVVVFRSSG